MADPNIPPPKDEPFTGPRHERFKTLAEVREDAEQPAGEFEEVHPASRPTLKIHPRTDHKKR